MNHYDRYTLQAKRHRAAVALFGVAVVLALGIFAWRGPVRGLVASDDYILIYGPARAWLTGGNPYDAASIDQAWAAAGGPVERRPSLRHDGALLYPPTTLALFSPFAALPWSISLACWIAANVALFGIALWMIAQLAGFKPHQRRTWVFLAAALVFAPAHTALHHGQTPIFVAALLASGFAIARIKSPTPVDEPTAIAQPSQRNSSASGVLLGLATLIKPQIGLPFLALEVLRRRWLCIAVAAGTIAAVAALAITPLMLRDIPWWSNWQANIAAFTNNSVGDPTADNPLRHQLLNLHYPLHTIIESKQIVSVLVFTIVGGLALIFFRTSLVELLKPAAFRSQHSSVVAPGLLLSLSMVAVLSLMIVYHRTYDAVVLLFPLAWAIDALCRRNNSVAAWVILLLLLPFFGNSSALFAMIEKHAALPSWMIDEWWWNILLKPMHAWALLLMAIGLIWAHAQQPHPHTAESAGN